jgi:hypothetical protein
MPVSISGDGAITGLELEAFEDVDVGSGASDGDVLTYDASGDLWIPQGIVPIPGIGSNVVQTISSTTFSTSSTSYVDVTDLDVTITPSSSSSKILLIAQVAVNPGLPAESQNTNSVKIQFAGGNITTDTYEPIDMLGSRPNDLERYDRIYSNESTTMIYLDSPATTSAVTYKVQVKTANYTALVNQTFQGKNTDSSITAIEVAA